jgi:1,6-anhydro-N-acetylmuramate kinase
VRPKYRRYWQFNLFTPPTKGKLAGKNFRLGYRLAMSSSDLAVQFLSQGQQTYDHNGQWSAQGQPCSELVHKWLQEPYFQQYPPKSTGRELFSPAYLAQLRRGCPSLFPQ